METPESIYSSGEYLERHPGWHAEDSAWKAGQILRIIRRNRLTLRLVSEIGCGAGEVLRHLQPQLDDGCVFHGYELSPQAFAICQPKENDRLKFFHGDIAETGRTYDASLVIDVIEHVEDYLGFLRQIKPRSEHTILHIPLDLHAQGILRNALVKTWDGNGHLHFFTRDTAFRSLELCGYRVLDWFYTHQAAELPPKTVGAKIARIPRRIATAINEEFAVRALGGFSIMVLAR